MRPAFNIYCSDVRSELRAENKDLDHFKLTQELFKIKKTNLFQFGRYRVTHKE